MPRESPSQESVFFFLPRPSGSPGPVINTFINFFLLFIIIVFLLALLQ